MYRIHFDPQTGEFVIQVMKWGLFWTTVSTNHSLTTYDEARAHVGAIGLDKLYQDRSENLRQRYMAGAPILRDANGHIVFHKEYQLST